MDFDIFNDEKRKVLCVRNDEGFPGTTYAKLLTVGAIYTVEYVTVEGWYTYIGLREFPDKEFNSVLFEELGENADTCENINGKKRLQDLPQYHIDRRIFEKIIKDTVGYEKMNDAFCYGEFAQDDEFSWWRYSDEFYILHKQSGMLVNWYKHFGRTNTCSQKDRTVEDYYVFFTKFNEELDYWYKSHNRTWK